MFVCGFQGCLSRIINRDTPSLFHFLHPFCCFHDWLMHVSFISGIYFFFLVSSPSRHANVGLTDWMVGEAAQRWMWQGTHSSAVHISHFKHSVGQVEHLRGAPGSEVSFTSWVPSSICFRLAGHLRPPLSPHLWPHERREHLARDHLASYPCDGFCQTLLACHRRLVACRIRTSGDIPGRCIVFSRHH